MAQKSLHHILTALDPELRSTAALNYAKQAFRSAEDPSWLTDLDGECASCNDLLSTEQWRVIASDLAWWVRGRRDDDAIDRSPASPIPTWQAPALGLLVAAQFLRYDFRFDDLDRLLRPIDSTDALLKALHLFSRLGSGQLVHGHEVELVRRASDTDQKVLQCLLHGLCVTVDPAPWALTIIDIADELERKLPNPEAVLYYRRAIGHRLAGHWERADADLRRALSLVPPDNSVHQQFSMELSTVASERLLHAQLQKQERQLRDRLEEVRQDTLEEIEKTLRSGLIANFQILTIFLTLAGFVGSAGATVLRLAEDKITWERAISTLSVLLVFTFLVLAGSQLLTSARFRRRSRR